MDKKIVGTKWYKCDFHLHTNASKCFEDDNYTPDNFIKTALEKGLDCIAVTDHNSGANIDSVKSAAEGKEITIFPGVEITCTDSKIHILVLFNPDYTTQNVEDFLLQKMNLSREKFGEVDAHIDKTVTEILKIVSDIEAIAIPAHIDEYSGLSIIAEQIKRDLFQKKLIPAVQIVHNELSYKNLTQKQREDIVNQLNDYYNCKNIDIENVKQWNSCAKYTENIGQLTFSDNPTRRY
ncbi:MAG: PHP domain-containing protein [Candidatus Marinimicrobia bacterium]|nr:PHP domain-containing protein [Candidatus Neomarinimicrobiota bacterium]